MANARIGLRDSLLRSTPWTEVADRQASLGVETLSRPADSFLAHFGPDVVELRSEALSSIPSLATLERGIPAGCERSSIGRCLRKCRPKPTAWIVQLKAESGKEVEKNVIITARELRKLQQSLRRPADGDRSSFALRICAAGTSRLAILRAVLRSFTSHYDLLASEARLTSLVADAEGDVPIERTGSALGRPMRTEPAGSPATFVERNHVPEFLMPLLFTNSYDRQNEPAAMHVKGQMLYGKHSGVPWGYPNRAYSALDAEDKRINTARLECRNWHRTPR